MPMAATEPRGRNALPAARRREARHYAGGRRGRKRKRTVRSGDSGSRSGRCGGAAGRLRSSLGASLPSRVRGASRRPQRFRALRARAGETPALRRRV